MKATDSVMSQIFCTDEIDSCYLKSNFSFKADLDHVFCEVKILRFYLLILWTPPTWPSDEAVLFLFIHSNPTVEKSFMLLIIFRAADSVMPQKFLSDEIHSCYTRADPFFKADSDHASY